MSERPKYLIDTNIFIQAYKTYYSFDIAPSFWELLKRFANNGDIISIDRVKLELLEGNSKDRLSEWAENEFSQWFKSTEDYQVIESYSRVVQWVNEQEQYKDYAKAEFADIADSWLIAYALAYKHTIVTHEQFNRDAKSRVLIPNVCSALGIRYLNTFDMLRELQSKIQLLT